MNFELTEELRMLRDAVCDFAAEKIAPFAEDGDHKSFFPCKEAVKPMGELCYTCAQYAMKILGAYGCSPEYPVARIFHNAPTCAMVEGSTNICKFIMAQDRLWIRKATR